MGICKWTSGWSLSYQLECSITLIVGFKLAHLQTSPCLSSQAIAISVLPKFLYAMCGYACVRTVLFQWHWRNALGINSNDPTLAKIYNQFRVRSRNSLGKNPPTFTAQNHTYAFASHTIAADRHTTRHSENERKRLILGSFIVRANTFK